MDDDDDNDNLVDHEDNACNATDGFPDMLEALDPNNHTASSRSGISLSPAGINTQQLRSSPAIWGTSVRKQQQQLELQSSSIGLSSNGSGIWGRKVDNRSMPNSPTMSPSHKSKKSSKQGVRHGIFSSHNLSSEQHGGATKKDTRDSSSEAPRQQMDHYKPSPSASARASSPPIMPSGYFPDGSGGVFDEMYGMNSMRHSGFLPSPAAYYHHPPRYPYDPRAMMFSPQHHNSFHPGVTVTPDERALPSNQGFDQYETQVPSRVISRDMDRSHSPSSLCLSKSSSTVTSSSERCDNAYFTGCILLSLPEDEFTLNELHCFIRENVEAFTATDEDVAARHSKGVQKLMAGQVSYW